MPYIKQDDRKRYEVYETSPIPQTPGDFNYVVARLALRTLGPSPSYTDYNAIIGALECCKLEIYRQAIAPYEDSKKDLNGNVF